MALKQTSIFALTMLFLASLPGLNSEKFDGQDMSDTIEAEGTAGNEMEQSEDTAELDAEESEDTAEGDAEESEDTAELDVEEEDDTGGLDAEEGENKLEAITAEQAAKVHTGIDTDKDGLASMEEILAFSLSLQRSEAKRGMKDVFEQMDQDHDGKLNLHEYLQDAEDDAQETAEEKQLALDRRTVEEEKFKAADTNGNGFLEMDEAPAMFSPEMNDGVLEVATRALLKSKDKDADAQLSLNEFWDVADGSDEKLDEHATADFKLLDTDGNEKLNLDELKVFESGRIYQEQEVKKLFAIADKNSDKRIGLQELHDAREQIAASDAGYLVQEWADKLEL